MLPAARATEALAYSSVGFPRRCREDSLLGDDRCSHGLRLSRLQMKKKKKQRTIRGAVRWAQLFGAGVNEIIVAV